MRLIGRTLVLACFLAIGAASGAMAVSDENGLPPGSALPVRWAPRLAGGPIRALVICPDSTTRDAEELALRLDLRYEVAPVWGPSRLDAPESGGDAGALLASRLGEDFDVVVVGNVDLSILPEQVLGQLQSKIEEGTGLVLANCMSSVPEQFANFLEQKTAADDSRAITRGVGESLTPEWPSNLDFVSAGVVGRGRVVELNYAGDRPLTHCLIPGLTDPLRARPEYLDVYFSLAARAIRWAAGRSPSVAVAGVDDATPQGPADVQVLPSLPDEYIQVMKDGVARPLYQSYVVRLESPADRDYTVVCQVREPSRGIRAVYQDLAVLKRGQSSYLVDLPIGPGKYFLDLWFYDKKDVCEWHTAVVTVYGWPEISDLAWSKGALLANDRLNITMNIRPHLSRPRGCTVYAQATDSLGRLVGASTVPVSPEGGAVQVVLNFADLLSNFVKVEVFAADVEGRLLTRFDMDRASYSHVYMPVRAPRAPAPILAVQPDVVSEYNARSFLRTLRDAGADSVCVPVNDDARFYLAEHNLRAVVELGANAGAAVIDEAVPAYWAAGATLYSLGRLDAVTPEASEMARRVRAIDLDAAVGGLVASAEGCDFRALCSTFDYVAVPDEPLAMEKIRSYRSPRTCALLRVDVAPRAHTLWRQALCGMQGVRVENAFAHLLQANGRVVDGFGETARAIEELRAGLGALLARAKPAPAEVALLDCGTAEAQSAWVERLKGYSFDFVSVQQAGEGKLRGYKVVVSADSSLPEPASAAVGEFEARGGKVVLGGNPEALDVSELTATAPLAGKSAFKGATFRYEFGSATLLGFLSSEDADKKAKQQFAVPAGCHVYDLRKPGKGRQAKQFSFNVARGEAALYSILPYEVRKVDVTTLDSVDAGKRLLLGFSIETSGGAAGVHLAHVELQSPDGTVLGHYCQDVVFSNGQGTSFIPLALNEKPGVYVVRVRDVLSGAVGESRVTVGGF